jgi:hypothetical protein
VRPLSDHMESPGCVNKKQKGFLLALPTTKAIRILCLDSLLVGARDLRPL